MVAVDQSGEPVNERDWQSRVLDYARLQQWTLRYHTFDSRHSPAGFPDLVLLRPPELIWVELKTEKGKLSPAQVDWLDGLHACNQEAYVWRPRDWDDVVVPRLRSGPRLA